MKKKAVNLWLSQDEYLWLRDYARERATTMTAVLRALVKDKKAEDERTRRPDQF